MLKSIKNHLKQMKWLDVVIIALLFMASFIPHGIYAYQLNQFDQEGIYFIATVTIDGEEVYRTELDKDAPHEEFTLYPNDEQYNIIEVDGERIRNKEDNSPDQIGVRRGWISQPGEMAIVLPHRLIVEVHAENESGVKLSPSEVQDSIDESDDSEDTIEDEEDVVIPM